MTLKLQPLTVNEWVDFYYYELGQEPIPWDVKKKADGVLLKQYKIWFEKPLPEEQFNQWKEQGMYDKGIAIIIGQSRRGPYKGLYLCGIDMDNKKGIDEICPTGINDVAKKTLVEQHKDNPNKAHVYYFTHKPVVKKSSDTNNPEFEKKIEANEIPALEVKGNNGHGIMFCTPSQHEDGYNYQVLGTLSPQVYDYIEQKIDDICSNYGIPYLVNAKDGKSLIPMSELTKKDFEIHEGHNRHEAIMRYMESKIQKNPEFSDEKILQLGREWNNEHCKPQLDEKELQKQFKDAKNFIIRKNQEKNKQSNLTHKKYPFQKWIDEFLHSEKYFEKIKKLSGSNFEIIINDLPKEPYEMLNSDTKNFVEEVEKQIKKINENEIMGKPINKLNIIINDSKNEIPLKQALKGNSLNKLVRIKAMVNGESSIKHRAIEMYCLCEEDHDTNLTSYRTNIIEPKRCSEEKCKSTPKPISIKTQSYRRYYLKDLDHDSHHTDVLVSDAIGDFVDYITLADNIEVIGYLSMEPKRKGEYENLFNILNATKLEEVTYDLTEEDKRIYEKWPEQDEFYTQLINSIAPDIYKSELNKESILLSYVGAPKWRENQRQWINVLSVGDPGTAKSNIAYWAAKILPNVESVSSNAGTAKGFFAGQKEQADGEKVLEIGPMIKQSNKGLVIIDEFTRMSDVFEVFYTPMETGRFDSATVGGHAKLPSQTPVYATGNPKKTNYWDEDKSILENLQTLEPAMLSRFDLIIISKDDSEETTDQKIGESILGINQDEEKTDVYNERDLAKYLLYCKTINPVLTHKINKIIVKQFAGIRKQARANYIHQEITNRLVGTIARLTLAIARIHLHREATESDVSLANRLLTNMFAQRGLKISNVNTYIDRIAQKIFVVLEEAIDGLTDIEIFNGLKARFPDEWDSILNDIGSETPLRSQSKKWREIMKNVEKSTLVTISNQKPRRLRYRHEGEK